jgi:hypothetical protein
MSSNLSDKAIAVFAFAAYHQLTSGETVREVVVDDHAGHKADPEALKELSGSGFLKVDGVRAVFTEAGQAKFDKILSALHAAAA